MKKNILLHCAMEKEAAQIANKLGLRQENDKIYRNENSTISLIITGIGKQKTAIEVIKYIENNEKPELIVNIGYAGSTNCEIGTWVNVSKVYNLEWEIPGEEKYSMKDTGNQELIKIEGMKQLECYSAEKFVTKTDLTGEILFDMELHSLAIICDMYKIPLLSLKKVSDNLSINDYYKNIDMEEVMELKSSINYLKNII